MTNRKIIALLGALAIVASACTPADEEGHKVDSSGKEQTALDAVPQEVLDAALAARPELAVEEVEYETRDGKEYYDVGGTLPDGSELELDMTLIDGVWTAVEFQRDIGMDLVPPPVATALAAGVPDWMPTRIIESDQGDGTIVYEFFGPGAGDELAKYEVKWTDGTAELLVDEWAH